MFVFFCAFLSLLLLLPFGLNCEYNNMHWEFTFLTRFIAAKLTKTNTHTADKCALKCFGFSNVNWVNAKGAELNAEGAK